MSGRNEGKAAFGGLKAALGGVFSFLRRLIRAYDRKLRRVYSPNAAALAGTVLVLVMAVITLFLPPYIGVADDGSLSDILHGAGLGYRNQDLEYPTGAYYVRLYLHSTRFGSGISTHRGLIRAAIWLDDRFTGDNLFDLRFLALLYLLLYLPAVWLALRGIASRVKLASEATLLTVLSALVLGDAASLSYFNSLYPEAMWQVFLIYCLGFCLALQHTERTWTYLGFFGLTAAGSFLALSEAHCAAVGMVLMVYCMRQLTMEDGDYQTKTLAVFSASVLLIVSVVSWSAGATRFTEASKLHSMTNGVLLRAKDPERALADFNIEPRYETLTDTSSYADYPYTLTGNPEIQEGFLDRYTPVSLVLYYARHPLSFTGLMEMGTEAAFRVARSYVGNYEASVGLPPRARNPVLIAYSNLKSNSLPQTMGFLLILTVVFLVFFRRRRDLRWDAQPWTSRERQIMIDTFLCFFAVGLANTAAVIVLSGTAELERYQMLFSSCIDALLLLFFAEILHRLNIIGSEE